MTMMIITIKKKLTMMYEKTEKIKKPRRVQQTSSSSSLDAISFDTSLVYVCWGNEEFHFL